MNDAADQLVFGTRPGAGTITWFHPNLKLGNANCLYCGALVGKGSLVASDKEHLIGRRMVPKGSLAHASSFNLLFRACVSCNSEKALLEEHISAITLLSSPQRAQDPRIDELARRKGRNSFDPRHPGQPVAMIRHEHEVKGSLGPASVTVGMVSGAQLDPTKVRDLARRHIQGLFALLTSEDPRRPETTNLLPPAQFGLFGYFPRRDWGNPQLKVIAGRADALERLADINTAEGFFRATLRRKAEGGPWFWAMEWNASYRVVGWISHPGARHPVFEDLPEHQWIHQAPLPNNGIQRMRLEVPLEEGEADLLFPRPNPA